MTKRKRCHTSCRQLRLSQKEPKDPIVLISGKSILNGMKIVKRLGIGLLLIITGENPRRVIPEGDPQKKEGLRINLIEGHPKSLLNYMTEDLQKKLRTDTEEELLRNMIEDQGLMISKTEIHMITMAKGLQKEGI